MEALACVSDFGLYELRDDELMLVDGGEWTTEEKLEDTFMVVFATIGGAVGGPIGALVGGVVGREIGEKIYENSQQKISHDPLSSIKGI